MPTTQPLTTLLSSSAARDGSPQKADTSRLADTYRSTPGLPRGGAYRDFARPGTTTFFLTAPYKPVVHLVGDFNNWDPKATLMESDGCGVVQATLPVRGRARYEFLITMDQTGQQVYTADPYATEIDWDDYGPKAVVADDAPYQWHDRSWQRPPLKDLVIYELCVRDFSGRRAERGLCGDQLGRFAGVTARLDYLQSLGVNAIELMPVGEFPGDSSWGYNPVFYMAPKSIYGRPDEFRALIDAAHQRGIAVILDLVFNHAWGDHPYYRMYPPLFTPDGHELPHLNPFFHHHHNGHANSWGGVDWDHHSPYTLAYMQDIVRFWLNEYHMDGFRFDWLGGVEYDPWQPLRENFDPFYGIAPIARAARATVPDCYLIGEYWPIHGTNQAKTAVRLVQETEIDAVWNGAFHHVLEDCLFQAWQWERQDVWGAWGGFYSQGFAHADQLVNYVVCHDERRPEYELQYYAQHVRMEDSRGQVPPASRWELGMQKARLGLALLATAPGVPMLFAGQEFGADSPRTIDFWPLDWSELEDPAGRAQLAFYQRLLAQRRAHPALRSDHIEFYMDDFARYKVLRYKRWSEDGDVVVVALNFDCVPQPVGLGFPSNGAWEDAVSGQRVYVTTNWHNFVLPAWTSLVLSPVA